MEIINPQLIEDLANARPLRINVGCGQTRLPGYYGVDLLALPGVDVQADLNQPLDKLPENCVSELITEHTLEHVSNLVPLLGEFHRIVRPDGRITITVPHFSNPMGYSDPTHVRFFGLYSMFYFAEQDHRYKRKLFNYYSGIRFRVLSISIRFARHGLDRIFGAPKERLFNFNERMQALYERHFCWIFPADEITYVLTPVK